tara:strand:- start:13 stop:942 length:930 start_codon:yes stop_codon:yes gene_type:complete
MRKIYFVPNWGLTSEQMVDDYKNQTPDCSGVWEDIQYTLNPNEADYLIIQDECNKDLWDKFEPEQRLYFSREALTPNSIDNFPEEECQHFSFWDETGYLWTKWWYPNKSSGGINMTYDELVNLEPMGEKLYDISCILSNKEMCYGHSRRKKFVFEFSSKKRNFMDIYGSVICNNKMLENNDKRSGLMNYNYHLAFDNQDTIKDFFGTQFTDALLCWTVPIFWGGGDGHKYFPEGSYETFNVDDYDEIDRIVDIVESGDYLSRLPAIKKARELILNKYNMWPTIKNFIDSLESEEEYNENTTIHAVRGLE